jgi:hypothetical protein
MTYLEAVNSVLTRLRESQVTTVNQSAYSRLIGEFVNDTIREVSEAWKWNTLRVTYQIQTVANTFRYELTGAGSKGQVLQVFNDTDDHELTKTGYRLMTQWLNINNPSPNQPTNYAVNGQTVQGDLQIDFYPIPNGVYTLNVDMLLPQATLSTDGTDDVTLIEVPSDIVILGTWAKAVSERGEDSGTQFAEVFSQYQLALGDGIARDVTHFPGETVWMVE